MELVTKLIDIILHVDQYLHVIILNFGIWTYMLLFTIVFCETGFVITPFLPGDSLLFAVGAFAAKGSLNVLTAYILLVAAAIAGDTVNYWIGNLVGPRVFQEDNIRFFKRKHLERTEEFYEKHGGKTIIIARFVPIIRTFAPFVAGIGSMSYGRFLSYNIIGGVVWVSIFVFGGYYFGNLPIVKENFSLVIIIIIFLSVLPGVFEFLRQRNLSSAAPKTADPEN